MQKDHRPGSTGPAVARETVQPHECPLCDCDLVEPTYWRQVSGDAWRLDLRCPECDGERTVILDGDTLHAYNVRLYEGTELLARRAEHLARERTATDTASRDAFVAALRDDRILPMDF